MSGLTFHSVSSARARTWHVKQGEVRTYSTCVLGCIARSLDFLRYFRGVCCVGTKRCAVASNLAPVSGLCILKFILVAERFFHIFQSLEIIGDMYQHTEAFCHYSSNSPEPKISSLLTFQYLEKKAGRYYGRLKNCAKKMSKIWKQNSPIRMTLSVRAGETLRKNRFLETTGSDWAAKTRQIYAARRDLSINFENSDISLFP